MSQDTSIVIQNYQGTFILDLLNEFRKDVIRCIFRDMVVPPDAANQRKLQSEHAVALESFLCDSTVADWCGTFATWLEADCPSEIKQLYISLQREAQYFVREFRGRPKAQVWAYLYSQQFSEKLRISAGEGQTPAKGSLAGLFNVVALSVDQGKIKLIQPPNITLSGGFHTLTCCFPSLSEDTLNALAQAFSMADFISLDHEASFSISPALYRGHTAVCYNTGYYKFNPAQFPFLAKSRKVFNTCFLQIRPIVDASHLENPVGFIQLQCCLPGFMDVLVPKKVCKGRNVLCLQPPVLTCHEKYDGDENCVVLTEFPDNWLVNDLETQTLCAFWRLSELAPGWLRRLYNFLELSKRQAVLLENELRRREQQRYRQRLELLEYPIDQMLAAVSLLQKASSEVRAIVRDPCDAIFGIHHLVAPIFDENSGDLYLTADFAAHIRHEPSDYNEKDPNDVRSLRCVIALLLRRWTNNHEDTTKMSYSKFVAGTVSWLDEAEHRDAIKPLVSLIRRVLFRANQDGETLPLVGRISDLLSPTYPFALLKQSALSAKILLFTPFKLGADQLGVLPIAVALNQDAIEVIGNSTDTFMISDPGIVEKKISLKAEVSPLLPRDIIQFLIGISGEIKNRTISISISKTCVQTLFNTEQSITVTFASDYLIAQLDGLKESLDKLIQTPRDWRIELGAAGNFAAPYMRLATRLLGVNHQWFQLTNSDSVLELKEKNTGNLFKLIVNKRVLQLIWKRGANN